MLVVLKKLLFLLPFILIASNNNLLAEKKKKCPDPHATGEDIYRHYTGTIGPKQISLDLRYGYCGAANYGGSIYYENDKAGSTLFYIREPKSFDHNETLIAFEQPEQDTFWSEIRPRELAKTNMPEWVIKIDDDKLTGKWVSTDRKDTFDIFLREDYNKSIPMDINVYNDASSGVNFVGIEPHYTVDIETAYFITKEELSFLSDHDNNVFMWTDFYQLHGKKNKDLTFLMPVYNDEGFLVLEKEIRENNLIKKYYLNLDLKFKQFVGPGIMNMGSKELPGMLEKALRAKYHLDSTKKLSTWFYNDIMPVATNIMLTNRGVNFCYNPGVLYKVRDDAFVSNNIIRIFLSYDELKGLLKDDFKVRIGLKAKPKKGKPNFRRPMPGSK